MSKGKILVVGIGPGNQAHMTGKARQAITEADVVIGYATYIKLIKDLLDGKQVIRKGMTEEANRCLAALRYAEEGHTVALISSGDAGIYGMAALTYEVLFQAGWKPGDGIGVEVIPGCTALSACASLVGAPLGHDFCSISLSDLLTPWPVIARRLEAAARADFVLVLYNPKSGRRTGQIVAAQEILMRHRKPDTPVAIVNAAYRPKQSIRFASLVHMAEQDIGMLSTVLIGNRETYLRHGVMITSRGYAGKYLNLIGTAREGEKAGHSLSLGLDGWHGAVRQWLHDSGDPTNAEAASAFFDMPIGQILAALTSNSDDPQSHALARSHLVDVLGALDHANRLVAVMNGQQGVMCGDVTRLTLADGYIQATGSNLHAQVPEPAVAALWLMQQPNGGRFYLLNRSGESILRLDFPTDDWTLMSPFLSPEQKTP
uniref:Precorrin-3 methyltransferase n=1 Tax=Candidatus Kentrum sp. TUN TaxID=2126343 RepID=A0A450ZJY7_9GAMM|nr:MAG: precorrin-3 methyltransferase [Candidatus Kentron sp. TUN]